MSTFAEINEAVSAEPRLEATFDDLIHGYVPEGSPVIDAASVPYYNDYPADLNWEDLFPFGWMGLLLLTIAYNWWDGARTHWGTKGFVRSTVLFDLTALIATLAMFLDTVVSVNGTYLAYGSAAGIEANANLRQWAAVWKRVGLNYAQSMALTDVLEGAVIWSTWYYGRKRKNFTYLLYLLWLGFYHFYYGFLAWPSHDENLINVGLFFRQLFGQEHAPVYQGGGPQTVVGIA